MLEPEKSGTAIMCNQAFKQCYLATRCLLGCAVLALAGFVCLRFDFGVGPRRSESLQQLPWLLA
jgi:hypothetical protein